VKDIALLVVMQGYEGDKYWSGENGDGRNMRTAKDLLMVESSIISDSVPAVLSL
jgi:hypothetical protein